MTNIKNVVTEVETNYPETTKMFKEVMQEQYELFCLKQSNYGPDNISLGTTLEKSEDRKMSQMGIWFRLNDKIQRLKQLVVLGNKDNVGESVKDTYQDLSVYGIICQIVVEGKWGK
jgi:hypothetical protein|tara:strand:+ start:3491 stop:3838 length:348 start_codon:yes stop_codon:yes gene_type:complete